MQIGNISRVQFCGPASTEFRPTYQKNVRDAADVAGKSPCKLLPNELVCLYVGVHEDLIKFAKEADPSDPEDSIFLTTMKKDTGDIISQCDGKECVKAEDMTIIKEENEALEAALQKKSEPAGQKNAG